MPPRAGRTLPLSNLATLLNEAGSGVGRGLQDHCLHQRSGVSRRGLSGDRPALSRHPSGLDWASRPTGFARPEILFEIDAPRPSANNGGPHPAFPPSTIRMRSAMGSSHQALDCDFCMAVRRRAPQVILHAQPGTDLNEVMHGAGNPVAQAEQAMENVAVLLGEAGATLAGCHQGYHLRNRPGISDRRCGRCAASIGWRATMRQHADREGPRQSGTDDGGRYHRDADVMTQ